MKDNYYQRGSAKSRKKLSKSKDKFLYMAPRLKDGKMTDPELLTYKPLDRDTMDKAATKIQSLTRGRQSRRNLSDMKSEWYKGFPSKTPKYPLDLQDISKITEGAIQGIDSRLEREKFESKRKKITDRYQSELDKLNIDLSKYNWGRYYENKDITRPLTEQDLDIIRFEKKNYDKLKKIADKRKYWLEQLEKIGKATEYSKFNPNKVTDTQQYNIRGVAVDYYEDPEATKDHYTGYYYDGKYYDSDEDRYKYFEDYRVEEAPELSSLNSNDDDFYSEDDELLIPRDDIATAVEYYKTQKENKDKLYDRFDTYMDKYNKLEEELDKKLELDIEKCLHAKKLANADIKLYKDRFFMTNFYEPCSDNENLTQIYMDTFYSLPWQLIKPVPNSRFGERIDDMIHNIPREYWNNALITTGGQERFKEILRSQGLAEDPNDLYERQVSRDTYLIYNSARRNERERIKTVLLLSNFYRWAVPGNVRLVHIQGQPSIMSRIPGRSHLQETFNMLDEAFEQNPEHFKGNVEKVKRFFILRLIGIVGNPEYKQHLERFMEEKTTEINAIKENLEHNNNELKTSYKVIDDIISKFQSEGIQKDRDIFIREYRNGLLAGLNERDNDVMFYYLELIDRTKPHILTDKNKLFKLETELETAKRFSRITGTEKDYMTWTPERLVYE